jgi:hypothetical protein
LLRWCCTATWSIDKGLSEWNDKWNPGNANG